MSKVESVHEGDSNVRIITISNGNKFATYSNSDPNVKIWKLQKQKKKSILDIDEEFWGCENQINFREKMPIQVTSFEEELLLTF